MISDLRLVLRRLKSHWHSFGSVGAASVVAVALMTSLAAIVDGLLFRQPFAGAEHFVVVGVPPRDPRQSVRYYFSAGEASELERSIGRDLGIFGMPIKTAEAADDVPYARVSVDAFRVLNIAPAVGRGFEAEDIGDNAVLIADRLWRSRFGASTEIIGHTVDLPGRSVRIIGVMPPGFDFPRRTQMWSAIPVPAIEAPTTPREFIAVTRARAEGNSAPTMSVRDHLRPADLSQAFVFMAAGVLLLVIVWIQVGLMQAGAVAGRIRELRTRLVLGASTSELARSAVLDGVVLVVASTIGGALLSPPLLSWVMAQLPAALTAAHDVVIDERSFVTLSAIGLAGLGTVAFATFLVTIRIRWGDGRENGASTARVTAASLGRYAVTIQFVAAAPLLYLTFLAAQSVNALLKTDLGFRPEQVFAVPIPQAAPDPNTNRQLWVSNLQELLDRVALTPGVQAAATSLDRPGFDPRWSTIGVWLPSTGPSGRIRAEKALIAGNYFDVLRIPLLEGNTLPTRLSSVLPNRGLGDVVIDELLAREIGGVREAVGQQIIVQGFPARVVGVVGTVRPRRPDEQSVPRIYQSVTPAFPLAPNLLVRFAPGSQVAPVVAEVVRRHYGIARSNPPTLLVDAIAADQSEYRGRYTVLALAAVMAAIMTAAGIFGLGKHMIAHRQRELAVRLAIGATRRHVTWVASRGLLLAAIVGGGAGQLIGLALGRGASSMLYDVAPIDGWALAAVSMALVGIGATGAASSILEAFQTNVAHMLRQD